ncbi:hypothetical protein J2Z48_001814 [Croceifilum oryzae]|uniref:Uncharacterized protein n=1 Tax=Croceifilum oryzae TaxID=1553429 RepID=A0AAJ1WU46_9BACL|nr:hypothetical protein [Croceifilum oryzae]MDQ0417641.1 hypothetical protein [Croceifilum oryzae]
MSIQRLDNVFYPLGGMGYLVKNISDLFQEKVKGKGSIRLCFSAQPNSYPHLGTVMSIMVLFAIGEHLRERLNIPVYMQFDKGEHCIGDKKIVDGVVYSKSLEDVDMGGISKADFYMKSFNQIFTRLSEWSSIPYKVKNYRELQGEPFVRGTLLNILRRGKYIIPIISPSERKFHLRFPCPICKYSDKHGHYQEIEFRDFNSVQLVSNCFEHGKHSIVISEENEDFFDINTALYDLLLGAYLIETDREEKTVSIMIDGGDYAGVWPMLVHSEALLELGFHSIPNRLFAPLILDWSGAKFSKSLYVKHGAYSYLPKGLLDFSQFEKDYGSKGFDRLWIEAREWANDPVKFFRNYSMDYFNLILNQKENYLED